MKSLIYSGDADLQASVDQAMAQFERGGILIIQGPTGVGKSELAQRIHAALDSSEPFISQDAAGLSEQRFESQLYGHVKGAFSGAVTANPGILGALGGGTLCVEGLEDLGRENQARMLRFLQSFTYRPVGSNVEQIFKGRLIFTAQTSARQLREQGFLREDFYYRIANFELSLPPLESRAMDFVKIAQKMISRLSGRMMPGYRLPTREELENLAGQHIDGNLHGLWNLLQQAMIQAIPPQLIWEGDNEIGQLRLPNTGTLKSDMKILERSLLARALKLHPHSRKDLAQHLDISLRSLLYKLKEYDLGQANGGIDE